LVVGGVVGGGGVVRVLPFQVIKEVQFDH